MLSLSRRPGESFTLEHDGRILATVEVREVEGRKVTIGITAPADVHIMRDDARSLRQRGGPALKGRG